jgi:hypothetical protein
MDAGRIYVSIIASINLVELSKVQVPAGMVVWHFGGSAGKGYCVLEDANSM